MPQPIRVLVASALGHVVGPPLAERFDTVSVVTSGDEMGALLPGSLRYDVAIVDLLWNAPDLEWVYDGFDAIQQLVDAEKDPPVVLAAQGHGFERDYLDEAQGHRLVKGVLVKAAGLPALVSAITTVATGGRYKSDELPAFARPALTVDAFLSSSELASHVAGAIATGRAHGWNDVADLTTYSASSVQKALDAFGDALYRMGEIDDPTVIRQATVFRWCGEHARYILSWCRRHGLDSYSRSPAQDRRSCP